MERECLSLFPQEKRLNVSSTQSVHQAQVLYQITGFKAKSLVSTDVLSFQGLMGLTVPPASSVDFGLMSHISVPGKVI